MRELGYACRCRFFNTDQRELATHLDVFSVFSMFSDLATDDKPNVIAKLNAMSAMLVCPVYTDACKLLSNASLALVETCGLWRLGKRVKASLK